MKVSGMGPVARMLFRALALTTVWGAETAFAGAWSCRVLTEANPLPASANLLRGRLPTASSRDGTATEFTKDYALRFTDGKIAIGDVWWNEFIKDGGAYVCYSVTDDPAGVALTSVRFTTTHQDKGRSQVRIAKLSVQTVTSGETWVELTDSSVIGPEPQPGETNFQAVYAESDDRPIAEGVTAIRLDFDPKQQNEGVGFGEIEATALYPVAAWTRKTYATSAETCPLLPSADILHGKPPAVSADGMSVVCGLGDGSALALGSVRVTSALEAGIRSLQVRTEATGETWFTLPASGLAGIGDGGVCQAVYANAEALPLVSGATGLKVVFAAALPDNWAEKIVVEATEAGIANWTCCPLAEPNPMPEAENALLGLEATAFACNGVGPSDVQTNLFTDGKIALGADGWRTRIMDGGAFVGYNLSGGPSGRNGMRLRNVRVTTTHGDRERSEVRIDALFVKTASGGDTWFALPNSSCIGPDDNVRLPNNQATYARRDGGFVVPDATDLLIAFSAVQQNGWIGLAEIESSCRPNFGLRIIFR